MSSVHVPRLFYPCLFASSCYSVLWLQPASAGGATALAPHRHHFNRRSTWSRQFRCIRYLSPSRPLLKLPPSLPGNSLLVLHLNPQLASAPASPSVLSLLLLLPVSGRVPFLPNQLWSPSSSLQLPRLRISFHCIKHQRVL